MNLYLGDLPADLKITDSIAIDTEAMGLVTERDRLCLVQMATVEGEVFMVQFHPGDYQRATNLKKILEDPSILKIFHYARFDVALLNHTFGIKTAPIYCTKIASKLVRTYTDSHGLKNLCKELLNVDISKQEQSSDWGSLELSQEQMHYAASDVLHLHKLREKLNKMLVRENKFDLALKCFDAIHLIVELDLKSYNPETLFTHQR